MKTISLFGRLCAALAAFLPLQIIAQSVSDWPQFRGPDNSGVAAEARPPLHFGPGTNLLWKSPIPPGLSSPVVWGRRVFLTGFESNRLMTLAYDARTGRELWRRFAPADTIEKCHEYSSPAAPTPCTDGRRVYAYFGSYGLIAYDFSGREVWRRPLERLPSDHGTATSPILAGNLLILQHDGDSTNASLLALAPRTGKTVWEAHRPLAGASYSTPMIWRHDGMEELIVQGKGRVSAYSLKGGPPRWWVRGWSFSSVATPVAGGGLVFAGGGGVAAPSEPADPIFDWLKLLSEHDANRDGKLAVSETPEHLGFHQRKELPKEASGNYFPMRTLLGWMDTDKDGTVSKSEWDADEAFFKDKYNVDRFVAIRPGGAGDVTDSHVLWETTKGLPEMPSALYYQGRICFVKDGGMWTVIEPATGRRLLDRERLGTGGRYVASPIAAHGHIYLVNESGTFTVLRAGDTLSVAAVNALRENVRCTPALVGDTIYVRSENHLWAFAAKKQ